MVDELMPVPQAGTIDLVILDLDGTILDLYRAGPISQAVCAAIAEVQARGVPVTIATGRTLDYVRNHVANLELRLPVVTGQGAVIGDPQTGTILEEIPMSRQAAVQAAAWIDAYDYVTALYFTAQKGENAEAQTGAGDRARSTVVIYQNRIGDDPCFYDHVFGVERTITADFSALVAGAPGPPLKFIVAENGRDTPGYDKGDAPRVADLVGELQATLGHALTITRTHPRLVEGTARGVDKGAGVLRLCARLGIDPARVLAIGDSDNDIPMLQAVGYGIGMGNASPGVRAVARWLAPPIDEDGVAVALRRWILDAPASLSKL
jgi:hydroxymethylpyrimidine pyrophosphatase-like HAD family hydrolase